MAENVVAVMAGIELPFSDLQCTCHGRVGWTCPFVTDRDVIIGRLAKIPVGIVPIQLFDSALHRYVSDLAEWDSEQGTVRTVWSWPSAHRRPARQLAGCCYC